MGANAKPINVTGDALKGQVLKMHSAGAQSKAKSRVRCVGNVENSDEVSTHALAKRAVSMWCLCCEGTQLQIRCFWM